MPERLAESGLDSGGMCISDSRTLVNYYRPTMDGRFVFGMGGGRLSFGNRVDDRFNGASPRSTRGRGVTSAGFTPTSRTRRSRRAGPVRSTAPSADCPSSAASTAATTCSTASASPATAWGPPPSAGASLPALVARHEGRMVRVQSGAARAWGSSPASLYATSAAAWSSRRTGERSGSRTRAARRAPLTAKLAGLAPAGLVPVKGVDAPAAKA